MITIKQINLLLVLFVCIMSISAYAENHGFDLKKNNKTLNYKNWTKILTFDTDLGDSTFDDPVFGPLMEIKECKDNKCRTIFLNEGQIIKIQYLTNDDSIEYAKIFGKKSTKEYIYDGWELKEIISNSDKHRSYRDYFEYKENICYQYRQYNNASELKLVEIYEYFPEQNKLIAKNVSSSVNILKTIYYDENGFIRSRSQNTEPNILGIEVKHVVNRNKENIITGWQFSDISIDFEYENDEYGNWVKRNEYMKKNDQIRKGILTRDLKYAH